MTSPSASSACHPDLAMASEQESAPIVVAGLSSDVEKYGRSVAPALWRAFAGDLIAAAVTATVVAPAVSVLDKAFYPCG